MSADSHESRAGAPPPARLPEVLDAWRMVAARRGFEGTLPLSSMGRLRDVLCDDEGEARYAIEFGRDALQVPYVELRVQAALPLTCQRSLRRFLQPVQVAQRLALLDEGVDVEAAEAGLPEGYEPLLVPADGTLRPAELVEDELILAVPVVPVAPGSEAVERDWPVPGAEAEQASPFAALAALKKRDKE
ncbi:MAG TPA: YceD family protein [Luteimonas sp.]